jgi:type IV pilus assembly protein PilM
MYYLSVEEKKEILLFAASEQMVNDYSSLLTSAKLKPVVADASCVALYRLILLKQITSEEDHTLCLQFDIPVVQLSVFHHHKPYFFNHLKLEIDNKFWNFKHHSTGIQQLHWQGDAGFIHGLV